MATPGNCSALIHLYGAACGTVLDTTGVTTRNFQAVVLAAAVTDDDFTVIYDPVKVKQSGQTFVETISFVQNRDDYAELNSISRLFR
jgi:hypothetical protein